MYWWGGVGYFTAAGWFFVLLMWVMLCNACSVGGDGARVGVVGCVSGVGGVSGVGCDGGWCQVFHSKGQLTHSFGE